MSWIEAHSRSEKLAGDAGEALREGHVAQAHALYRQAAQEERTALGFLSAAEPRTYGIIAVSAVALYMKAGETALGREVAKEALMRPGLPAFAAQGLRDLTSD